MRVRIVGIIIISRPDYSYVSNGHRRIRSSINHGRDISWDKRKMRHEQRGHNAQEFNLY